MKRSFEKKMWGFVLQEWAVSIWDIVMRTIWLCLAAAAVIGALRLMAWADTGSRGECPIEKSIIPTN